MKFDIVFHIVKAHFELRGYMSPEPIEATEQEAKDGFNQLQAQIGSGKLEFFVIFPRVATQVLPEEKFVSMKASEIIISLDLYKSAAVHMQLIEVTDGK